MSSNSPFTLERPIHFIPTTHGSASFMSKDEAVHLGLTVQGIENKFCPHVGTIGLGVRIRS